MPSISTYFRFNKLDFYVHFISSVLKNFKGCQTLKYWIVAVKHNISSVLFLRYISCSYICIKMAFENSQFHIDILTLYAIIYIYSHIVDIYSQSVCIWRIFTSRYTCTSLHRISIIQHRLGTIFCQCSPHLDISYRFMILVSLLYDTCRLYHISFCTTDDL